MHDFLHMHFFMFRIIRYKYILAMVVQMYNKISFVLTVCKYCFNSVKSFKVSVFWPNLGITSKQSTDFSSDEISFFDFICFSLCEQDIATATFCQIFTFSMLGPFGPFIKWLPVGVSTESDTPNRWRHCLNIAFHFWFAVTHSFPNELKEINTNNVCLLHLLYC